MSHGTGAVAIMMATEAIKIGRTWRISRGERVRGKLKRH